MTTKQRIYSEIESVGEESLDELYELIKSFVASKAEQREQDMMSKLKTIKIEAPADFAANLNLYLTGDHDVKRYD
jgi:hypothetical protein